MKKKYRYAGFYQVRTANYSKSEYLNKIYDENLKLINDSLLLNIIKSSSPSLAVFLNSSRNEIISPKIERTLHKYFNRISTRATPYSLFASQKFITTGENCSFDNLEFKNLKYYISHSSQHLEENLENTRKINIDKLEGKVRLNPLINEYKTSLQYTYPVERFNNGWDMQIIQKTVLLEKVISLIKSFGMEADLKDIFSLVRKTVDVEFSDIKIKSYINKLCDIGLLIPDPQYPIETKLGSLDENTEIIYRQEVDFQEVQNLFENNFFKTGRELFDSQLQDNQVHPLDPNEINRIVESANVILALSLENNPRLEQLQPWLGKFIEKWGIDVLVPATLAVDEFQGIGPLNDYLNPPRETNLDVDYNFKSSNQDFLNKLYIKGIQNEDFIVDIDVRDLPESNDEGFPLLDISVTRHLFSRDSDSNFVFRSDSFNMGGHSSSRFMYMSEDEEKAKWQSYFKESPLQTSHNELCTITTTAGLNVVDGLSVNTPPTDAIITVGTQGFEETKNLPINDIYVGARETGLYLFSNTLQKEISVITSSMVNQNMMPNVVRLLLDITMSNFKYSNGFSWGNLETLPILPAVRFKNNILRPAEWKIGKDILDKANKVKNNIIGYDEFVKFLQSIGIPRYFYIASDDNRILIDSNSATLIDILINEIINDGSYVIESSGYDEQSSAFASNGKGYFSEYILSLNRNKINTSNKEPNNIKFKDLNNTAFDSRWMTFNIYIPSIRADEYLNKLFIDFKNYFNKGQAYFIRYADPDRHIRLRFNNQVDTADIINKLNQDLEQQIISDWNMKNLFPEYERYGGRKNWDKFISLFSESSTYVLSTLDLKKTEPFGSYHPIISSMHVLQELGLDYIDIINLIPKIRPSENFRKEFNIHKSALLKSVEEENYPLPAHSVIGESIIAIDNSVSMDIVHMHINRLQSSGDAFERDILWACRTLSMSKIRGI